MKKSFMLLFVFLSFTAVIAQKTELKYNLETGREYFQEVITESKVQQHIMGMDMEISNTITMTLGYKVTAKDGRYYDMDIRYVSMAMEMETPYGSNIISNEKADENDPGSMMLARVMDVPFEVRMRDDGKVTEIKNIDVLIQKMMEDMGDVTDPMMMQIGAQLQQQFGENAMTSQIESYSRIFPDGPVAVGDQWQASMEMVSMMPLNIQTVYQFMGEKDGFYHIQGLSEISSSDLPDDASGMNMSMDMVGNQTFSALIDKATGWISQATLIQDLEGEVSAQNPMDGESINFTMIISSSATVKGR